jgi:ribosomal protein S7
MVARYRDLTHKYRSFRLKPDALYDSLTLQTLFNKFIRRGKKAASRRHLYRALTRHRLAAPGFSIYHTLFRHLRSLARNIKLVLARKGKQYLEVPVPAFRMKGTVTAIQEFYNATTERTYRTLSERVFVELLDLTANGPKARSREKKSDFNYHIYEMRVNMERR